MLLLQSKKDLFYLFALLSYPARKPHFYLCHQNGQVTGLIFLLCFLYSVEIEAVGSCTPEIVCNKAVCLTGCSRRDLHREFVFRIGVLSKKHSSKKNGEASDVRKVWCQTKRNTELRAKRSPHNIWVFPLYPNVRAMPLHGLCSSVSQFPSKLELWFH